ncbi:hypothetical protein [Propionispora hippei]|uniref:Uncharacterized protein n=1 Tax=Propionispora hippei DSM 15287 TaxID=1123003 RepID=A0A1M6F184_9FIRM|nr:hypothetical protein [Propionispora hippei]SHI91416.1 hypothetical protein SAMN02745170_01328 [Propionispora hippei DSM 15287]
MKQNVFADGIGAVHITGNLVRFDLAVKQPGEANGQLEVTHRLIMPLDGFVSAFNLQEQVIRQLTQNGVLVDGRSFPAQPQTQAEIQEAE